MKAGIYLGQEQIELRELPLPEVGDHDVLVQNLYSSVCGTDVAVFFHGPNTGHKVTVGGEFGHDTVSRVVKVGKDVTDFFGSLIEYLDLIHNFKVCFLTHGLDLADQLSYKSFFQ